MLGLGTILLADDEDTFLEATEDLLKEEGFDCRTVKNAEEMSCALKSTDFDLLITDLNMPGNRVLELVDEIHGSAFALPVIVVTGYPSIPTAVESVRLNVLEYMIKPVDFPKLLDATKRGVHHKKVWRSVQKAKQETALRVKQLAELEDTLVAYRGLELEGSSQEPLGANPQLKKLQEQIEEILHSLEKQDQLLQPTGDTSSLLVDYLRLRDGLYETIQVLQKTKGSFHSKELARLRNFIQNLLKDTWTGDKNK
ncbi:response regulator [Candidatus Nitronereus thalassa]|uniref:Response regulator n=1 Tax=Candidatus Nitronereus thalassa TaxID=3020898 RepID=A0ABU3K783_9BACT|nr:response regulator [Candidatus Nitronereus thalassa]MDT7042244.1 response regulator [Candidatus Nitronereus thalassa]